MSRRRKLTTATAGQLVTFTAAAGAPPLEADVDARIIEGLVVPFGQAGATSDGLLTFARGSVTWPMDARRVKLLREHDQRDPVAVGVEFSEGDEGIWGRFAVPEGDAGDRALAEVASGLRDGLSVGVALDAATHARLRRAQGAPVAGSGTMRETSLVTVPAFDDARVGPRRQLAAATGGGRLTTMTTPTTGSTPPAPPATSTPAPPTTATAPPAASTTPAPPATATAEPTTATAAPAPPPGPAVVRAAAGAALTVASEPTTYTLNGSGPSLVRDAYRARMEGDSEAAERLRRFNAELTAGNPASVLAFTRASSAGLTTAADPIPSPALTDDVNLPGVFLPQGNRADLMLRAVDLGRPIASRLNRIPITNAQPFLIPIEGEFDGVADHVEGTPHVAEGTLTLDDAPVTPRAVSGAYRVSRELADATNPAIDQIAMRAMLRDYRRVSEGKVVAALLAADAVPTYDVNTAMALRAALVTLVNDDDEPMDFVAASREMIGALYADVDTTGRPMLASGNGAPSPGSPRAGYTGLTVDGTDVVRASRLPANVGFAIRAAGVLFVESAVQQFRFDEVEGPGIIKLALWAYVGAAVLRAEDVAQLRSDADPTP